MTKFMRFIWFSCLCLMVMRGLVGAVLAQDRPASVGVDQVIEDNVSHTVPVIGRIVATQRATVAAKIAGPIKDVRVAVGQRVQRGDPLVILQADRLQALKQIQNAILREKQAALKKIQQRLALVQQEADRLAKLENSVAFSKAKLEDKRLEVQSLKAEVTQANATIQVANAQLQLADIDLKNARITAPFDGVIIEKLAEIGDYIKIGDGVVILMNDTKIEIEADVPTSRLSGLMPDQVVRFYTQPDTNFTARLRHIIPEEKSLTRTQAVRFSLQDMVGKSIFSNGQSVTVNVPIGGARRAIMVAKDAVMVGDRGLYVYAVQDQKAVIKPVKLGEAIGSYFIVEQGLKRGDVVVTRGNERLRPNQTVKF